MPIKYIGRVTTFAGKPLWQILYKLKDFGVGRMVYRNMFERYPEASYYVITHVSHNPEIKLNDGNLLVKGKKTWRGRDVGEMSIDSAYKADWRVVPRLEEAAWLASKSPARPPTLVAPEKAFPPLLERMILEERRAAGLSTEHTPTYTVMLNNKALSFARTHSGDADAPTPS